VSQKNCQQTKCALVGDHPQNFSGGHIFKKLRQKTLLFCGAPKKVGIKNFPKKGMSPEKNVLANTICCEKGALLILGRKI